MQNIIYYTGAFFLLIMAFSFVVFLIIGIYIITGEIRHKKRIKRILEELNNTKK